MKPGMGEDVHLRVEHRRPVRPFLHRLAYGLAVDDHYLRPQFPGPRDHHVHLGRWDVGDLHAHQHLQSPGLGQFRVQTRLVDDPLQRGEGHVVREGQRLVP